jgi:GAF domain-containing protein
VDTVFFRKRNEDISALRCFAQEAAFITERDTLLERTRAQVLEHSEASSVYITMLDEPGAIDLNDPAILAMRTWHDAIELHRFQTALVGEYAFPMFGRGSLLGVLVCGAKKNGEAFAPDEIDALKALAYGAGAAVDVFDRTDADRIGSLLAAFATLRNDVMARFDALTGEAGTVSHDPLE